MTVEAIPLSSSVGAEIRGVDLAGQLEPATFADIRDAWHRYKVLLFRDQRLDPDAQLAFARRFGDIQVVRSAAHILGGDQAVMHVANREVDGKPGILPDGEMQFHTDQCYYERPSRMTMLYAIAVPKAGGHTLFLNAAEAYATLPDSLRREIANLHVRQVYDYDGSPTIKGGDVRGDAPQFVHPLVIRHPETGMPVLYANRLMSERIVELERPASDRLLGELFDHMEQRRFIYEHAWRVGDLVLWDNLAVMHARTDFDPAEARILRRVTIAGTQPRPAVGNAA